jgi:hypothetical protein
MNNAFRTGLRKRQNKTENNIPAVLKKKSIKLADLIFVNNNWNISIKAP